VSRASRLFLSGTLVALVAVLAGAALLWWDWHAPYKRVPKEILVSIPKGMHAGQVMELLSREGMVRNRVSFKLAYGLFGHPRGLRAGTYKFDRPLSPIQVIEKLNRGEVVYIKVTVPEGLRAGEVAHLLAEAGLGREPVFLQAIAKPQVILDLDSSAKDLEGYLFPETYLLDPALNEEAVVQTLVRGFRQWWLGRGGVLPVGMTLRSVVTLASLVEEETAVSAERGLVAGVFANRLRLGMPLQTDPTIVYAQSLEGVYRGTLTRMDWGFPSPYNTYLHSGLPPGPICNPGRASLEAALNPTPSAFLYFVSRNDGAHAFSRTLEEHNRAVAHYQHGGGKKGKGPPR
jgi:UPF0755 protein